MNAIMIGMMTYVILVVALAVIIITGLSLLAWLLAKVPGHLHVGRNSPTHGEHPVPLHELTLKI